MATSKPSRGIGPVPEGLSPNLSDFLSQMRRQMLDVNAGRLSVPGASSSGGTGGGGGTIVVPGPGGDYEPDLTPPPTPSGVNVVAGIDFVGFTTDPPTFTQGHGHLSTVVYGKKWTAGPLPTFSDDSQQFEFPGNVDAWPTDPATQWHFWLKWKTRDGVLSVSPAGGANGFQVTTGQDVTKLLEALQGMLRNEQLDPTSNFRFKANLFTIESTSGTPAINPFTVVTTPTLTPAGELLPVGVYMEAAYVKNLEVAMGRFQNAFITNAMIVSVSASRITAGVISVGNYIQSSNYVPGVSGWKILGDGNAEFAAGVIRGQLTAGQIDSRGLTIRKADGTIILDAGASVPIPSSMVNPAAGWLNSNVTAAGCINRDPMILDPTVWDRPSSVVIFGPDNLEGASAGLYLSCASGLDQIAWDAGPLKPGGGNYLYPLDPGRTYNLNANFFMGAGNNRNMYLIVDMFDRDGNRVGSSWGGTYSGYVFGGQLPTQGRWYRVGGEFGAGTTRPLPASVVACRIGVWFQYSSGTSTVQQAAQDIRLLDVSTGKTAEWAGVSGSGRPQDNATVGATIGANLGGNFSQASWDVVMAGQTLIRAAHIQQLTAANITVATLSQVVNGGATSGGRIVMEPNKIIVFDSAGAQRVKIGYLG